MSSTRQCPVVGTPTFPARGNFWDDCRPAASESANDGSWPKRSLGTSDGNVLFWSGGDTFFEDATWSDPLPQPTTKRALNFACHDISKSRVAAVFEATFGYPLAIDPTTYDGDAVEKSEINSMHDGRVVRCPADRREGYVYQRLIDTSDGGSITDLRTPCIGGSLFWCGKSKDRLAMSFPFTTGGYGCVSRVRSSRPKRPRRSRGSAQPSGSIGAASISCAIDTTGVSTSLTSIRPMSDRSLLCGYGISSSPPVCWRAP